MAPSAPITDGLRAQQNHPLWNVSAGIGREKRRINGNLEKGGAKIKNRRRGYGSIWRSRWSYIRHPTAIAKQHEGQWAQQASRVVRLQRFGYNCFFAIPSRVMRHRGVGLQIPTCANPMTLLQQAWDRWPSPDINTGFSWSHTHVARVLALGVNIAPRRAWCMWEGEIQGKKDDTKGRRAKSRVPLHHDARSLEVAFRFTYRHIGCRDRGSLYVGGALGG
ncbi:hypothetical protein BO70DRAFT_393029 [Aspergillus heteromorphus CBS 117.55]|uniref:Uncharacterized protein n=1 Tax=Aspergillus heteromorphus CBS 117.55 TaxID=1448321 RepID=A0A317WU01_9EURO|nr:uncharacterized protein BO70DRAFT_393029 [Aspergillus heteromorphus CBS 117.55]PWY89826.1 hypothetical protein BO70DRAFT_393029 [Aspergillus heteromorphus CBS 117.55]